MIRQVEDPCAGAATRASRTFFAITDEHTVTSVTGYSCPEPNMWWCPSVGYTLTIGHHLFGTREEAVEKCRKELQKQIRALQLALLNLK